MSNPEPHPDSPETDVPAPPEPPPANVGGQDALDGEAQDVDDEGNDTRPTLAVRDRTFHLRSGVPNALLGRVQKAAKAVMPLVGKDNDDLTEDQRSVAMDAQIAVYDTLMKLVVPEERESFGAYCEDVDPVIDAKEWSDLMGKAVETISGRPTTAS